MKRRAALMLVLCLLCGLACAMTVSADSGANRVELYCTVNTDGDCLVSMTVTFHMDAADKGLMFPLPAGAKDIKMNGGAVTTTGGDNCILAAVGAATGGIAGDFTARFDYTLPGAVKAVKVNNRMQLQMDLPLLCGFSYPVYNLNFVITLPGSIEGIPYFSSTYRQYGFESNLDITIKDNMLTGNTKDGLNDHEAVYMNMTVPRDMFPGVSTYQRDGYPELYPMGGLAAAALLYWLLFLRTLPPPRVRSTTAPAGISAGELGCRLTMSGGDLTMMVLSWAQMGYLLIRPEGHGRVLLYKRMDMGNERSLFEVRTFQSLFASHNMVDCTGMQYAKLLRRTQGMIPGERAMCRPHSGNRKVFRWLLCLAMVFCGICTAMNMTGIVVLEVLLCLLFGIYGIISAWHMQQAAACLRSRKKLMLLISLGETVLWVLLGLIGKQIWIPLGACAVQILSGFLYSYGGMRTELNRYEAGEILGMRRYLKYLSKSEADRLQKSDPEFFFRMAPYAIALGVGKSFASAFGSRKLDQCPWLVTRVQGRRTADEWMRLLTQSAAAMDDRARRMELEKWMAVRFR